jgi:hypothetical protein
MNPISCLFGSRFAWNLVFLWAGALLFDEKIRQSAAHANVIQTSRRLDSFLHEEDQNFELLSNIRDKNSKT